MDLIKIGCSNGKITVTPDYIQAPNACRACLSTDRKLFDIHVNNVDVAFEYLTGSPVKLGDGLPQEICVICWALLRKGATFKEQCLLSQSKFQDLQSQHLFPTLRINKNECSVWAAISPRRICSVSIHEDEAKCTESSDPDYERFCLIEDLAGTKIINVKPDPDGPTSRAIVTQDPLAEDLTEIEDIVKDVKLEFEVPAYQSNISKTRATSKRKKVHHKDNDFDVKSDDLTQLDVMSDSDNDFDVTIDQFLSDIKSKDNNKVKTDENEVFAETLPKKCKKEEKPKIKKEIQKSRSPKKKPIAPLRKGSIEKVASTKKDSVKKGALVKKGRAKKTVAKKKKKALDSDIEVSDVSDDKEDSDSDFDEDSIRKQVSEIEKETAVYSKIKIDKQKVHQYVSKQAWEKKYNIEMVFLDKEEQIRELKARQDSAEYTKSTYKCDHCYKGFMREDSYKRHMVFHDPSSGNKVCGICHMFYNRIHSYRSHMERHKTRLSCRECGHITRNLREARDHYDWHNGKRYGCKKCGKVYNKKSTYMSHLHMSHSSIRCNICNKLFVGEHGRRAHMMKAHRMNMVQYRCSTCLVQFLNPDALQRHIAEAPASGCKDVSPCEHCGLNLPTEQVLLDHLQKVHNITLRCEECKITFKYDHYYTRHRTEKHEEGPDILKSTDEAFRSRYVGRRSPIPRLPSGEKGEKRFMCEFCGRYYPSNAALIMHQRTHTGEKPFPCALCPKRFSMKIGLKMHMYTHTGEKPYKCSHCHKSFSLSTNRDRHVNEVHIKAKAYTCDSCDKVYYSSGALYMHVKTVHMNQPWPKRNRRKQTYAF